MRDKDACTTRDACVIEEVCRDKDFSVTTYLDNDEKKNDPRIRGVTTWYQIIGIRIPRARWARV